MNRARCAPAVAERAEGGLVQAHLGFVVHVAREFRGRGLPLDDLVAEGYVGLIDASRRFDPLLGVRFTTYAGYWVRKSILEALASQPHVIRVPRYARLRGHRSWEIRIDVDSRRPGGTPLRDRLVDHDDTSLLDRVIAKEAREILERSMSSLSARERSVLVSRFGLRGGAALTLRQVGARLGLSRERVRQIEVKAIGRLRKAFGVSSRALGVCAAPGPRTPPSATLSP